MSQLRIGVDVGFDHLKVIANGRAFISDTSKMFVKLGKHFTAANDKHG